MGGAVCREKITSGFRVFDQQDEKPSKRLKSNTCRGDLERRANGESEKGVCETASPVRGLLETFPCYDNDRVELRLAFFYEASSRNIFLGSTYKNNVRLSFYRSR